MAQPVVPRRWAKNALDGTGKAVPGILWGLNLNADGKAMGRGRRRERKSRFACSQWMLREPMRCQRRDRGYHGTICNDVGQRKSRRLVVPSLWGDRYRDADDDHEVSMIAGGVVTASKTSMTAMWPW